ncbi:MAG: hypothetical protein ABSE63_01120 [Thermoguttaceae bacterium]|jgi:hypothetical protein
MSRFRLRAGLCRPGITGATRLGSDISYDILFLTLNKWPVSFSPTIATMFRMVFDGARENQDIPNRAAVENISGPVVLRITEDKKIPPAPWSRARKVIANSEFFAAVF